MFSSIWHRFCRHVACGTLQLSTRSADKYLLPAACWMWPILFLSMLKLYFLVQTYNYFSIHEFCYPHVHEINILSRKAPNKSLWSGYPFGLILCRDGNARHMMDNMRYVPTWGLKMKKIDGKGAPRCPVRFVVSTTSWHLYRNLTRFLVS